MKKIQQFEKWLEKHLDKIKLPRPVMIVLQILGLWLLIPFAMVILFIAAPFIVIIFQDNGEDDMFSEHPMTDKDLLYSNGI